MRRINLIDVYAMAIYFVEWKERVGEDEILKFMISERSQADAFKSDPIREDLQSKEFGKLGLRVFTLPAV